MDNNFKTSFMYNLITETENLTTNLLLLDDASINNYFSISYYKTLQNTDTIKKNYKKEAYLYDIIVILKFYAIIHRLYWYHFNITLNKNENNFNEFIKKAKLKFTSIPNENCRINNYSIIINNLFDITTLDLNKDNKNYIYIYNIDKDIINNYNKNFDVNYETFDIIYFPLYHNFNKSDSFNTKKFELLDYYINNDYDEIKKININDEQPASSDYYFSENDDYINIKVLNSTFTTADLLSYCKVCNDIIQGNQEYSIYQRILLYLNVFNNVLNLENNKFFLIDININIYKYNKILYNALIQYGLVNYINCRFMNLPSIFSIDKFAILKKIVDYYNSENKIDEKSYINYAKANIEIYINDIYQLKKDIDNIRATFADLSAINHTIYNELKKNITDLLIYIKAINDNYIIKTETIIDGGDLIYCYLYNGNTKQINKYSQAYSHFVFKDITDIREDKELINAIETLNNPLRYNKNKYIIQKHNQFSLEYGNQYYLFYYTYYNTLLDKVFIYIVSNYDDIIDKYDLILANLNDLRKLYNSEYNFNLNLNDIYGFNENLKYDINAVIKSKNDKNISDKNIINTYKDKLDFKDFNNNMQYFEDISNKYKNEWKIYNNGLYYYRILLIISIILFLLIIIISNININVNFIILIFIIKIILILCLILFIYKKPNKEHFTSGSQLSALQKDYYSTYILTINNDYNIKTLNGLVLYELSDESMKTLRSKLSVSNDNFFNEKNKNKINDYFKNAKNLLEQSNADNILNDFNEKLQYYKVKSIDLYNNIELLKNTNVLNYYIILIIYVGFIFLIIGAICLILYPNKLYLIIISLTIIFIITLIILLIKMHKNTNMDNDKNYWSNFNPSDSTGLFNDDGLT